MSDDKLTREQLLERLRDCETNEDTEGAHADADKALLDYIDDPEVRAIYEAVDKWYA